LVEQALELRQVSAGRFVKRQPAFLREFQDRDGHQRLREVADVDGVAGPGGFARGVPDAGGMSPDLRADPQFEEDRGGAGVDQTLAVPLKV
jgi:hypothetical protein